MVLANIPVQRTPRAFYLGARSRQISAIALNRSRARTPRTNGPSRAVPAEESQQMTKEQEQADLVAWIKDRKIRAYDYFRTIARGDLAPKICGYQSLEHAAQKYFADTDTEIEKKIQAFEKKYPL